MAAVKRTIIVPVAFIHSSSNLLSQVPATAKTILKGQESFVDAYSCFFDNLKQVFIHWKLTICDSLFYQSRLTRYKGFLKFFSLVFFSEWVYIEWRASKGRHHRLVSLRTCYWCLRWWEPPASLSLFHSHVYHHHNCYQIHINTTNNSKVKSTNFMGWTSISPSFLNSGKLSYS